MTYKSGAAKVLIFAYALNILIQPCASENCTTIFFNVENHGTLCQGNQSSEVFRQYLKHPDAYAICCSPNTELESEFAVEAFGCLTMSCLPAHYPNPCDLIFERQILGSPLVYENVAQEPCSISRWWWPFSKEEGSINLCCPKSSAETWLIAMAGAQDNEFPHQAHLTMNSGDMTNWCGATIYNRRFLITAAHCLFVLPSSWKDGDMSGISAVLGSNIRDITDSKHVYGIKQVIPHPHSEHEWKVWSDPTAIAASMNDIALLELDRDIEFGENVKALEIAPLDFNPFKFAGKVVFLGWGNGLNQELASYLRKHTTPIRHAWECFQYFGPSFEEKRDRLLCVGGMVDGELAPIAIDGDSGGPAICRGENGHPVLCGVASFGPDKCQDNWNEECRPSVFIKVSYFQDWIRQLAGPQEPATLHKPFLFGRHLMEDEYLHQVVVETKSGGVFCGGTLIQKDVLITAAHCVINPKNGEMLSDLIVTSPRQETVGVKTAERLPHFKLLHAADQKLTLQRVLNKNIYDGDLAVVLLNSRFDIPSNKLARLPNNGESFSTGEEVSVVFDFFNGDEPMAREFKLLSTQECKKIVQMARVKFYGEAENDIICELEKYSGGSTCDRDLGGGLICKGNDGMDVLCGVQHLRLCISALPSGFVNVREYVQWIRNTIVQLRLATQSPQGFLDSYYRQVFKAF